MICTSIQNKTLDEILEILESGEVEMAEIRLDLCDLDGEEIEELFSESDVPDRNARGPGAGGSQSAFRCRKGALGAGNVPLRAAPRSECR